ncbi:MAG: ribonuclease D [Xanthomonadales bacterium]|nr:ribonuclease D [Xanthomonadales bacterium]
MEPATGDGPWLRLPDDLADFAGTAMPLAVDTEFMRERTYWPNLALVQVAWNGRCGLLDPLRHPGLPGLGDLLADPRGTVLMHSASEDLVALQPLLPAPMLGLYDTQVACAFAGLGLGLGYQAAVGQLLGVHLEKQETRSDWLARPLTPRQIEYALDDVRHLAPLHAELDARLAARGYREWLLADCREQARAAFAAEPDPQPQRALRGAWRWPPAAQAQLRRILRWREENARERNLPKRWVIDDETALAAAIEPDHSAARLAARLAAAPAGRRRSLQALLDLVARPPDGEEIDTTEPIPGPLEGEAKVLARRLRDEAETIATSLDLPPGLLCPRRAIDALAAGGGWPGELSGWREQVLRERLEALLTA